MPDTGFFSWTVPDNPSDSCLVKVSDTDGNPYDISDALFTISPFSGIPEGEMPGVYSMNVKKRIIKDNKLRVLYSLPEKATVIFSIYDIRGAKIKKLSKENSAGVHLLEINMNGCSAGAYFLKMEVNGRKFTKTHKVLLM